MFIPYGEKKIEEDPELQKQASEKKLETEKLIGEVFSKENPNQGNVPVHYDGKYYHRLNNSIIISQDENLSSKKEQLYYLLNQEGNTIEAGHKNDRTIISLNEEGNIIKIELENDSQQTHSLSEPAIYKYHDDGDVHFVLHYIKGMRISKSTFNAVEKLTAIHNYESAKVECLLDVIIMLSTTIARNNKSIHDMICR